VPRRGQNEREKTGEESLRFIRARGNLTKERRKLNVAFTLVHNGTEEKGTTCREKRPSCQKCAKHERPKKGEFCVNANSISKLREVDNRYWGA